MVGFLNSLFGIYSAFLAGFSNNYIFQCVVYLFVFGGVFRLVYGMIRGRY